MGVIIGNVEFFHLPRSNEELHESRMESFLGYLDYLRVIPFAEEPKQATYLKNIMTKIM